MFSRLSRYRRVPDVAVPDARGRVVVAKDIRPLPEVTGTFRHTVTADDRLDRLAHQYYRQPLQYWRICDANPDFLSPLALLGQEPVVTVSFPVTVTGVPPWAGLFEALAGVVGVEDVAVVEDIELRPVPVKVDGQDIPLAESRPHRAVRITYNRVAVTAETLAAAIRGAGLPVGSPTEIGQLGQQITIPPQAIG